ENINGPRQSTGVDPYIVFNRSLLLAQAPQATGAQQLDLLNQGFALVRYRCAQYFTALGKVEQHLNYGRKQTSLVSGLTVSAMGLANATAKAIAGVGSLFSFSTASLDTYEDVYVFSPDVKAVQRLVSDAMATYNAKLIGEVGTSPKLSYTTVVSSLAEYESFCQPHGVRDLVNQSLAQVRTSAAPPPATPAAPVPAVPAVPTAAPNQQGSDEVIQMQPSINVRVVPNN
ncbi:MAG TPA: hypothetical protein VE092_18340, partial [Herbaspirillum sp.]|uniref:hypothetical protein n=1 Tax=Herbaspirillum sp. TaxID=1890675 RepID=UPI002D58BD24